MELPKDFWTAAGAIISAIVALVAGIKWLLSRDREKESDRIAKDAHELNKKAFEAENTPQVEIQIGMGHDLTTSPPTAFFETAAINTGHVPVWIQSVGFRMVGSVITIPFFPVESGSCEPFPKLPAQLLPGGLPLRVSVRMEDLRKDLRLNTKGNDDEFTVQFCKPNGECFNSSKLRAASYLEGEGPIRLRLHGFGSSEDQDAP